MFTNTKMTFVVCYFFAFDVSPNSFIISSNNKIDVGTKTRRPLSGNEHDQKCYEGLLIVRNLYWFTTPRTLTGSQHRNETPESNETSLLFLLRPLQLLPFLVNTIITSEQLPVWVPSITPLRDLSWLWFRKNWTLQSKSPMLLTSSLLLNVTGGISQHRCCCHTKSGQNNR